MNLINKNQEAARCVAVVLAAGQGKRMNSSVHKQYLLIQDKPVLYYALKAFEDSFIDEIVLVTGAGEEEYCRSEIVDRYGFHKVTKIVAGGKERYHSVYQGIQAAGDCDYLFIHDGARAFVTGDILERCLLAVKEYGACVAGMPVKDTVKIADETGFIKETPNRNYVWSVQTPQVFRMDWISHAYLELISHEEELLAKGIAVTDDTMVLEYFSEHKIRLVEGSYTNIKITTPEDLEIGKNFLQKNENNC